MLHNGFAPVGRGRARPSAGSRRDASAGVVLRAVLDHGPIARSTIARSTGLSPAAVSGHTAALSRLGLLRELPEAIGPRGLGRPHVPLDLDLDRYVACGLHIAVPAAVVALLDLRGRIIASERIPHVDPKAGDVLDDAAHHLRRLLAAHAPGSTPLGLGVATGGWVDHGRGVLVEHPLLGWQDLPIRDELAERTGLAVQVDGHSRALVHAERLFGQARTRASVLQVFVGNVVDAAFATGSTVHRGPRSAAGVIAHLPVEGDAQPCSCGRTGCLQAAVSDRTLAHRAVELGVLAEPSFPGLVQAVEAGNPVATRLMGERATLVGRAVAQLIDLLNPELVIVVDRGMTPFPPLLALLREEVRARSHICQDPDQTVVPTSFPGRALATAAGAVMLHELYSAPLGAIPERIPDVS